MKFYDTLVYVCSPISVNDHSLQTEEANLEYGLGLAKSLGRLGVPCFSPHLYTPAITRGLNWVDSLNYDLAIVKTCDALLTGHGWRFSRGCLLEVAMARAFGIPVFYDFWSLMKFLSGTTGKVNYAAKAENLTLRALQSCAEGTEEQSREICHRLAGVHLERRKRVRPVRVQGRDADTEGEG